MKMRGMRRQSQKRGRLSSGYNIRDYANKKMIVVGGFGVVEGGGRGVEGGVSGCQNFISRLPFGKFPPSALTIPEIYYYIAASRIPFPRFFLFFFLLQMLVGDESSQNIYVLNLNAIRVFCSNASFIPRGGSLGLIG